MEYIAHVNEKEEKQLLRDHCRNTAEFAKEDLECIGLANTAYLAGLLHDMGKYTDRFQKYLSGESPVRKGEVIHTFQGCKYIYDKFHDKETNAAEIIAYSIGAHHGLFDCVNEYRQIGLEYRSAKDNIDYDESINVFFTDCATEGEIVGLFLKAAEEINAIFGSIDLQTEKDDEYCFLAGLAVRMLTSAVIDGDRRDTALFMEGMPAEKEWDMRSFWQRNLFHMEQKLAAFPDNSPITHSRKVLSQKCRDFAEESQGIFRLNLPTGAGKTLSSLRYALAHAARWNKKRLIFTTPLLSILDQNAQVIREFLADKESVLEHHSNVVEESDIPETMEIRKTNIQTWDAPVIITTLVQFLNTVFAGKTSNVRRFHALCDSVIVIDEVQTVPVKLVSLFNIALRFLNQWCGATIVLCSATQPCTEKVEHQISNDIKDMVPYERKIWESFERTEIVPYGSLKQSEIPGFIKEQLGMTDSLLVICNTKKESSDLVDALKDENAEIYHLSAGMCAEHRRDTINKLKESLSKGSKTLCVSTQVIEAGVDISFQRVIRLMAGMDSIVQSAGRCNRNGESDGVEKVYIVDCADEKLAKLQDIQRGKDATRSLIENYLANPEGYGNSLMSDNSIRYYYNSFFSGLPGHMTEYYSRRLDATLFDLLSMNEKYADESVEEIGQIAFRQAFKCAGEEFKVFEENTIDVVVPYGKGKELIEEICSAKAASDVSYQKAIIKQASRYSVSLYKYQYEALQKEKALVTAWDGSVHVLKEGFYDEIKGIMMNDRGKTDFLEA